MDKKLYFTVPKEYNNSRAKEFLRKYCGFSSRMLTRLTRTENGIMMDGTLLRTIDYVKEGRVVEAVLFDENSGIEPVRGKLDIVYEDAHFLIVNKPPSMPVHPVKQHQNDTLANIVAFYNSVKGEDYIFRAVNRLDKDTSGIVIIAKNSYCATAMRGRVQKTYYAVCQGKIEGEGTIDAPIGLPDDSKMVRRVISTGAKAVTHYKSILSCSEYSLLELWLETGRTHQIRCHMAYLGHPLIGDDLYGGTLDMIARQALHCGKLKFVHPVNNNMIEVAADIPEDMKRIITKIKTTR